MVSDQIGDFLTRIRNATRVKKPHCLAPYSNLKKEILMILQREGYIESYQTISGEHKRTQLKINLKYKDNVSVIQGIKKISKPGLRIYVDKDHLPVVLQGIGIAIISTSKGLMTNFQSKKAKLGGEVLTYVW